jgi:hypothetical protein
LRRIAVHVTVRNIILCRPACLLRKINANPGRSVGRWLLADSLAGALIFAMLALAVAF